MQDASAFGNAYCDLKWETYTEPKERPPLTANQPHSTSLTDAHLATVFSIDFFLLKQITHSLKENITGHMCPGDPTRTVSRNPNSRERIKYILCNFKSGCVWLYLSPTDSKNIEKLKIGIFHLCTASPLVATAQHLNGIPPVPPCKAVVETSWLTYSIGYC